jgi:hypothetical protein
MRCPHCLIHFHENWSRRSFDRENTAVFSRDQQGVPKYWNYRSAVCPGCHDVTIEVTRFSNADNRIEPWRQIYPIGANRGPVPPEVPDRIAGDYLEACNVLPISPKASAALSRRCLQTILQDNGYVAKDLSKEIDLLLAEADPKKGIPHKLRVTIDGIRNFGNFSAHPIDDKTTLQVIDVEPEEAEWCLEIIEEMFEHFYVGPILAELKKAALDEKLARAGKPPSK